MGTAPAGRPPGDDLARALHDMRGPLTVIRGLCEALHRGETRPDRRRRLRLIDGEAMRLAAAMDRLGESGGGGPRRDSAVSLGAIAAAAVERHRHLVAGRGARLTLRPGGGALVVRGDAERLGRALDNLLRNAARHCAEGGAVVVSLGTRGGWAHVRVRDDGPGVHPADRERVFAPGERGRAPRGEGRGLGLAIAREIARDHGGDLTLDRVGPGACFRLGLPLAAPPPGGHAA